MHAIERQRGFPFFRAACLLAASVWSSALGSSASAQEPLDYTVEARVDPERNVVMGTMHVTVRAPEGADGVRLWLYADRLSVVPAALDEINARWVFPGEADRGSVHIEDVHVDGRAVEARVLRSPPGSPRGRDVAGSDLWVPVPADARRAGIRVRFRLKLPRRFGRLGRADGQLTLAAPWYPLVVSDEGAYAFRVPHRVRVRLAGPWEGLLAHRRFRGSAQVHTQGPYVPLLVAPDLHERRRRLEGAGLRYLASKAPYDPPPADARGEEALRDLVRIDTVGHLTDQAQMAVTTTRRLGLPVNDAPLTVVSIPSRTELTGTAPGWVLVSDRLYEVFPLEVVRAFHHRAVRRAVFRHLLERRELPEPAADRPLGADLRAALLVDLDLARRDRQAKTPREILGWAGFHPSVDQLLYAPQVPFEDVYFGAVDDTDAFRDDPALAREPRSTGRRVLEMARDALAPETMRSLARGLLSLERPLRELLGEVAPEHADRLEVWVRAPGLPVNYRLGEVRSTRSDGRHVHRIEIIREGAHRPEPVEVAVEDEDGHRVVGRWDGEGDRGLVEVRTPAPLDEVMLDPRHRLVQSAELAGGHPRGDDATRHPWRPPILQAFTLSANLSEGRATAVVDFVMRRRYELDHGIGFRADTDPRSSGGSVRYIRDWGPRRHTNDRIGFVSAGVFGDRLHAGFTPEGEGGWRTGLRLAAGVNTHEYFVDPREGWFLTGSTRLGLVRQDDGELEPSWLVSARGNVTVPLGLRNVLLFAAGAAYAGESSLPGERPGLGGPSVLRGYESDERVGRGRVFGVVEHRWTALSDLALNALHLAWVRQIQLALFAGAGASFDTLDGEAVEPGAEVGAGVRFHFEYAGVQPGVLALDVGVPLVRGTQARARRAPVAVRVAFDQFF